MNVPLPDNLREALAGGGRFVMTGLADTGKTTLAVRIARETGAMYVDSDVGQSEVGPPGMMDLALTDVNRWVVRGQWYVGSTTPFAAIPRVVVGVRRLADRAAASGGAPVVVDTCSFVNTPAGHGLATALVEVLSPCTVVAVQRNGELEPWLRGTGERIARVTCPVEARPKPSTLRAGRRAVRLGEYFRDAKSHAVALLEKPLGGTRLGFGKPLTAADHRIASPLLGCPVLHGERGASSVAFWTLGRPRHPLDRVAAEFGVANAVTFDGAFWNGRSVGFIAPDGACIAMGVVEKVDWPSLTATVLAPVHSVADAAAIHAGLMRHRADGEGLPGVPERDA